MSALAGLRELNPHEPVCHLSFYEADAYARWAGRRLTLESELGVLLTGQPLTGNFADSGLLHPAPAGDGSQWYGDLWAWTGSCYAACPGFMPLAGSVGEYNGKFMSNQVVLKGACCATPRGHTRAAYRNFFYADERLMQKVTFHDHKPATLNFYDAVINGLSLKRKSIPPKFFYDEWGSKLFDRICEQPEYYPPTVERRMLIQLADEIASLTGGGVR